MGRRVNPNSKTPAPKEPNIDPALLAEWQLCRRPEDKPAMLRILMAEWKEKNDRKEPQPSNWKLDNALKHGIADSVLRDFITSYFEDRMTIELEQAQTLKALRLQS